MDPVLQLINLEKTYDNFKLDKISFKLERGYIMGFIGPNGAGKTTTIKLILDVIKPDGGQVLLFGEPSTNAIDIKERIGFVFGDNAFYEFLSAKEMAEIIARFYKQWDWNLFHKYMRDFGLNIKQKIDSYSKGMKVKFLLACALSHHAELLILDEPTSGLDPVFRSELMEIFQHLIAAGEKTILFSTHITSDLENIADYITFINQGKIVFSTEKDTLLEQYALIKGGSQVREKIVNTGKIQGLLNSKVGFSALTNERNWFIKNQIPGILIERASLEEIMVHYIRGDKENVQPALQRL
ncbi:MAG: ABC transporter ATP-binding protein [Firmicutes bacterium]|nr:ABC transporter ATP-binding protein [Bacillota bacterium]NLP37282.1 ABC transporter ATP-binding protein [Bacillota bacterium]